MSYNNLESLLEKSISSAESILHIINMSFSLVVFLRKTTREGKNIRDNKKILSDHFTLNYTSFRTTRYDSCIGLSRSLCSAGRYRKRYITINAKNFKSSRKSSSRRWVVRNTFTCPRVAVNRNISTRFAITY